MGRRFYKIFGINFLALALVTASTPLQSVAVEHPEHHPTRVAVAVVESGVDDEAQALTDWHAYAVSRLILENSGGENANKTVQLRYRRYEHSQLNPAFSADVAVPLGVATSLDDFSRILEALAVEAPENLRVVNFSIELSQSKLAMNLYQAMETRSSWGEYTLPGWREAVYGPDHATLNEGEKMQAVVDFVEARLAASPSYKKAMARYRAITRRLAERGVTVVIPVGNQFERFPSTVRQPAGSEFNLFAKSEFVISVAASFDEIYPDITGREVMAPISASSGHVSEAETSVQRVSSFSARGDGKIWNPTVTALGENVTVSEIGVLKGTSFSAPVVAGLVAEMVAYNPNLTFSDIRRILQETAWDTPEPVEAEGAGMLNRERVLAALNIQAR